MKLGIDFGTSRTVVAVADRGNYPLLSFETEDGTADWIPSLAAVNGSERRFGWDAVPLQSHPQWTVIRSLKRMLEDATPGSDAANLLNEFASYVLQAVRSRSNISADGPLQAVVGVPANANNNQRFLTVDAFRRAGFDVLGMINEPSAASLEFSRSQRAGKAAETILVYDLGGGTFDASLVQIEDGVHLVLDSDGIRSIGGDDFDEILAGMALDVTQVGPTLPPHLWFQLVDECRIKKEALNPNSRRIVLELDRIDPNWPVTQIPVADFYALARPLVDQTVQSAEALLRDNNIDALYVTGGGSELPLVARVLKETFGRRVRKSTYARSATAIGLAIYADTPDSNPIQDRLTRNFGVWREAEAGAKVVFDPIFPKGTKLPANISRRYSPVHNIGHFRFLECTHLDSGGQPAGAVNLWSELVFPFHEEAADEPIRHAPTDDIVEESYFADASGAISVQLSNRTRSWSQVHKLKVL